MSRLTLTTFTMPAADLGPENPLPALTRLRPPAPANLAAGVTEAEIGRLGWGCANPILPYRLQDGYNRERSPRDFVAIVLENEHLRATFLPEIGGRLWSLIDKSDGLELLYVNPVFQPANLAARNAWFSGGVEWNASVVGHSPLTCSPLFAATLTQPDGTPVLRLYEWDRIRGITFSLDAWLPDGSRVLYVAPRLTNPHEVEVPTYWWSTIATPELPGGRVLVPADEVFVHSYPSGQLSPASLPTYDGFDLTYPQQSQSANGFFFKLHADHRPWIAALNADGQGLVQTSTRRLFGRKLWVWGMASGGRRWNEFLSVPGSAYIEIQAGLARTQDECLPFPARAQWSWVETYGRVGVSPAQAHGPWHAAWQATEAAALAQVDDAALAAAERLSQATADRAPEQLLHHGSGWAALEERRRGSRLTAGLCFPADSLGDEQAPWLALLDAGALPERDPNEPPGAWLVQPEWRERLQAAPRHWLSQLHLGVMAHVAGDLTAAEAAWRASLAAAESAWAWRNLAVLARDDGDRLEAAERWLRALALAPGELRLAAEAGEALLAAGRAGDWLAQVPQLAPAVREHGRVRLLEARAALEAGELAHCEEILLGGLIVQDNREGEVALTELWFRLCERKLARDEGLELDDVLRERVRRECAVPAELDFRMGR